MVKSKKKTKTKTKSKPNMSMLRKVEVKRLDYVLNHANPLSNISLLNGVGSGLLNYQRVGDMVNIKTLCIKGNVNFPDASNNVRLMVVLDTQPNGASPAFADLFTFPSTPVVSFVAPPARRRFKIIFDKQYAGGNVGPVARPIKLFKKLNFNTYYKSDLNGIGDIQTNALWIITLNDSSIAPHPALQLAVRVTYTDE